MERIQDDHAQLNDPRSLDAYLRSQRAFWMQTICAPQVGTTTVGSQPCLRSCIRAVVRPCCCTDLTLCVKATGQVPVSHASSAGVCYQKSQSCRNLLSYGPCAGKNGLVSRRSPSGKVKRRPSNSRARSSVKADSSVQAPCVASAPPITRSSDFLDLLSTTSPSFASEHGGRGASWPWIVRRRASGEFRCTRGLRCHLPGLLAAY
jgi:hypothetical protein